MLAHLQSIANGKTDSNSEELRQGNILHVNKKELQKRSLEILKNN